MIIQYMNKEGLYRGTNEEDYISKDDLIDEKNKQQYPDKKVQEYSFQEAADYIKRGRELMASFEVGQREATWLPVTEYPQLPMMIYYMCDPHFGSTRVDTERFQNNLLAVENTPNFKIITNGDDVDAFNATLGRVATGMYEDPLPPQIQSRSLMQRYLELDKLGKFGVLSFGNHNDFAKSAGQDWYDSFAGNLSCPIFNSGGELKVNYMGAEYSIALTHRYWGTSKLNPTNACKRYMEHEYPWADIILLAHTHQSEGLHFERGGKDRIACIGGTFKDRDDWARTMGIGGRAGSPGFVIALWPGERQMALFKDVKYAQQVMKDSIKSIR